MKKDKGKMDKDLIIAGLDLGTNCLKLTIGIQHPDGRVDVIGTGTHPAKGFKGGEVCNADDAVASIRTVVEEAELMAGCEINEVFLAVSGRHHESFNSNGMVRIASGQVTEADVRAVIDMVEAVQIPAERQVAHVVPQEYVVDGKDGIRQPVGTHGVRLEASAHVVLVDGAAVRKLEACCARANLTVLDVITSPLAQSEAVLTESGRELGVVLIDIGGDTTDVSVFAHGAIVHSAVVGLGGEHITTDIKDCLNTPLVEAEHLKRSAGSAVAEFVDPEATVEVPGVGGRRPQSVQATLLAEIIEARVEEIFNLCMEALNRVGITEPLAGGIVLTGGGAQLEHIDALAERVTGMPASIGIPRGLHGLVDIVCHPNYATSAGLMLVGLRSRQLTWFSARKRSQRRGPWGRLRALFGRSHV